MDALDRQIVAILDRAGGTVSEHELRYQLRKHNGSEPEDLIDRLANLEGGGMVASELSFAATSSGVEAAA